MDGTQEREIHIYGWATPMLVTEVGDKNQHQDVTNIILAKIFEIQQNLYQELIRRFVPNKKEGKFLHRIKKLHRKINWEIERCPAAGVAVSQIIFQVTCFTWIF